MRKFVNEDSLSALIQKIKDTFVIKDKTEAQALVLSSTYPNCVYYTSDTHCIVIGGHIYGRGEQIVASNFAFLPASEQAPGLDPTFTDTTKIYVQPDAATPGNFKLWWCVPGTTTWVNGGSFNLDIPLTAEDISYDLTPTPDLGTGDVQSAIEALDGKVEQLSLDTLGQRTDGSVEEYWEDMQYEKYHTGYGGQNQNAYISGTNPTNLAYNTSNAVQFFKVEEGEVYHIKGTKAPNTHYKVAFYNSWNPKTGSNGGAISSTFISGIKSTNGSAIQDFKVTVPEGALMMAIGTSQTSTFKYYQANNTVELYRKVNRQPMSIADKTGYKIEDWTLMIITNTGVIGSKLSFFVTAAGTLGKRLEVKAGQVLLLDLVHGSNYPLTFTDHERVITELHDSPVKGAYVVPNDGYAYLLNNVSHETDNYIYNEGHGGFALYGNPILQDYYNKGLSDGSGMASIVGLGYNIFDYITGAVNMEGFRYGCEVHKSTPSISGNCDSLYKSNTSFVYFPRMDMTGVTRLFSLVQYCTNMVVFPETTFNGSLNCQNMFSGCTKLKRVGKLNGLNVEVGLYMFAGCIALERIEEVDISDMVMTTHKPTTNMFRSNSSTGSGTSVLSNLRYILLKGIGTLSSVTAYWFGNPQHWGVNTTAIPDAKQSLIDSLYTYSFDRKTAEYANCTIHLHSNTYNQLTTEEKEQITAKGYVLTTS